MANRRINCEKQGTASSGAPEPVVSEAAKGKGRKRVCSEDRSDELGARDLLEQLVQRFDKQEATIRAEMDSVKTDFMKQIVSTISHSIIPREQWIHTLQRDVLDLRHELLAQGGILRALRTSINDRLATLRANTTVLQEDVSILHRNLDDYLPNYINAFPQFRRLPWELRCMVWGRVAVGKILELHELYHCGPYREVVFTFFDSIGPRAPPVIAHVCRESRNIACRHGGLVWVENDGKPAYYHGPSAWPRVIRKWAWFDSRSDMLYFNVLSISLHARYADLLGKVRHLVLKPIKLEDFSCFLRTNFPSLTSVQLIIGSLEWPVRHDLEFESTIWPDGRAHVTVRIEGGADGAKRAHDDLINRLSPHCGRTARAALRNLATASKRGGADLGDWVRAEKPGYYLDKLQKMVDTSMLSHVWILSLVSEDMQRRVKVFPEWPKGV